MKAPDNPWQTLGSKIIYQNPWMTMREDAVRMPNGHEGIYGYIDSKPGVFIIALTEADELHLIESFRYPTQKWQWELPTGGIDEGKSPLEAAQHELAGELGITAETWVQINTFGPSSNGFMNDTQYVFLAQGLQAGKAQLEDFEAIRATKVLLLAEVMTMVASGLLADGQSLAALMQYVAWRNSR
jgi:8-oxo-dGTP pyrophosphatase MutT (NUDIX family)